MPTLTKKSLRTRRHSRIRATMAGTAQRPRVVVFKSNQHVYAQVIDDESRKTLVGLSDANIKASADAPKEIGAKAQKAFALGKTLADKMKGMKISSVLFDRGGFKYHGRVKAVAEGLRNGGIQL